MKKSPRDRTKNVLASNAWPKLPVVEKPKAATRAFVCVPNEYVTGDRALIERVAELEVSYKNLMNMYDTQIKINDEILKHISTLAAHSLACTDKRMNSFASALPRMMHPQDRLRYAKKDRPNNIMFTGDGSIISSMIECDMHAPLVKCIFSYTDPNRRVFGTGRFLENAKLVIDRTPWHLLAVETGCTQDLNTMGVHLIDALANRANTHAPDQRIWCELYQFASTKRPQTPAVPPPIVRRNR